MISVAGSAWRGEQLVEVDRFAGSQLYEGGHSAHVILGNGVHRLGLLGSAEIDGGRPEPDRHDEFESGIQLGSFVERRAKAGNSGSAKHHSESMREAVLHGPIVPMGGATCTLETSRLAAGGEA